MKIAIAADHGGFELKEKVKSFLDQNNYEIVDLGCHSNDSVDYPDYSDKAVKVIESKLASRAILICGTGIGMSIAANRSLDVRAALCWNEATARLSREHNNANMLCLGARMISTEQALAIIDVWLHSEFEGGRHQKRIDKFTK